MDSNDCFRKLADVNKDNQLDFEEFVIADILITCVINEGKSLPKVLPPNLIPAKYKWRVSREQRARFIQEFEKLDVEKHGSLSFKQFSDSFLKSGFHDKTDLIKIW